MPDTTSTPSGLKRCHRCGHLNRRGVIFCEECGIQISTGLTVPNEQTRTTRELPAAEAQKQADLDDMETMMDTFYLRKSRENFRPGTSVFDEEMVVRMEIEGGGDALVFRPFAGKAIVLGRLDPEDTFKPDLDLMPYDAHLKGISRRHAALTLSGKRLEIRDLNSSNGTYLNGVMLEPKEPHQLRDGDRIQLGELTFAVYFQE